jgi:hypothetical protein
MATSTTVSKLPFLPQRAHTHDAPGLILSATAPLATFGIANVIADLNGVLPLYFSPGLPGWAGALLHLASLPLFGIAHWLVARHGDAGRRAAWWIVALIAGTIAFPFIVEPLDSVVLSVVAFALLCLGLATLIRAGKVDPRAALIMAPALAWMGFSAFVGLSFAGTWSPPFALTDSTHSS